jgi:hypothetical protein
LDAETIHIVIHPGDEKKEKKEIDISRRAFLDWLSPINFFPRQQDILQMWQPGTGTWLLENPYFQAWKAGSGRTLWCQGIRA